MTDRAFTSVYSFLTQASDGMNFAAFVSPVRPLPTARWDSFTVEQASLDNDLDVLGQRRASPLGVLTVTGKGTPSAGGTVSIVGNVLLNYSPAQNPDFVGTETFTYTVERRVGAARTRLGASHGGGERQFLRRSTTVTSPGRRLAPLSITVASGLMANDGRPDIFPVLTPGNLLVTHSSTGSSAVSLLQEYTPAGVLVRSMELPSFTGPSADVRDLVVDRLGNIQVYNGTSQPRLTTYDPVEDTLTQQTFTNWNTAEEKAGGGLAAWRNLCLRHRPVDLRRGPAERRGDHPL